MFVPNESDPDEELGAEDLDCGAPLEAILEFLSKSLFAKKCIHNPIPAPKINHEKSAINFTISIFTAPVLVWES